MDWRNVQLATHEMAVGLQWKGYDVSIIQSNEAWVMSLPFFISEKCAFLMSEIACRGSEDLKYNCAVLNPDLKYR